MKAHSFFKKSIFLLALSLTCFTTLWAQNTITLINGQNYSNNITMTANTTITLASGTAFISGIISGPPNYTLTKEGAGKIILLANNIYTGPTVVSAGTLQVGNGTTNSYIDYTSGVNLTTTSSVLRFEPHVEVFFEKPIIGQGKVEYKGDGEYDKTLYLCATNTYLGTTTVETGGSLVIGDGISNSGKVAGNIILEGNSQLLFYHTGESTYSGAITGTGSVYLNAWAGSTIILTGTNTYTGQTVVGWGTMQIGNGTSGSITNTSNVNIMGDGTLRFEPGSNMTFSKVISGTGGKVEYKGANNKQLTLTADNTYTGTTTIEPSGRLNIGNGGTTGKVAGNIINNGTVSFNRSNAYTYDGIISGTGGWIFKDGGGTLTFTKNHTFAGEIEIDNGTLALTTTGFIAQCSWVNIFGATLDITSSSKTIKNLYIEGDGTINLGSNTLTIGTAGQADGGGSVEGSFIGTGSVIKTGTETLSLYNPNTATGTFSLNQGEVHLENCSWAGNFNVSAGTSLDVYGEVSIGGTLNFLGADIIMNLTTYTPSKLIINGAASAVGTNTLHVTSETVSNYILMQAASGLNNAAAFTLDMPGFDAELTATGTLLLLTATVTDVTPPVPGTGINGTAGETTAALTWTAATDNATPADNLRYYVYQSSSNNITTVANCEANGTLLNAGGTNNITSYTATGLNPETTYYFNVVVSDMASNKAAYTPKSITTVYQPNVQNVEISPKTATLQPNETQQFTVTVTAVGGANENVTWSVSGNLSTLTTVNASGLLTIGTNETAETLMVRVTSVFNSAIFDDATVTVGEVGIKELQVASNDVLVYPNPTTGMLTINNEQLTINNIEIYDIYGRMQKAESRMQKAESRMSEIGQSEIVINISDFASGIYFIKIHTDKGEVVKKVIKN